MEAVEFFLIGGHTCFKDVDGVTRILKQEHREPITQLLEKMRDLFPQSLERLEDIYSKSKANRIYYEYRIADHFIRCNFGEADFLKPDIEMNEFNFEEVRCPLRGICSNEGVICKPKVNLPISDEERRVVGLYTKGMTPGEIAQELGKSESTCKSQINKACKKLHLPNPRKLFQLIKVYPITI